MIHAFCYQQQVRVVCIERRAHSESKVDCAWRFEVVANPPRDVWDPKYG
jgi:hypothetical protein